MRVPGCVASLDRAALDQSDFVYMRTIGWSDAPPLGCGFGGGGGRRRAGADVAANQVRGVHLSLSVDHGAPWMPPPPPRLRGIMGNRAAAFDALHPPPPPCFTLRHEIGLYFSRALTASFTICVFTVTPVDSSPLHRRPPPPVFIKSDLLADLGLKKQRQHPPPGNGAH